MSKNTDFPFLLTSYHYDLPEDLIAQTPAVPADTSRLLVRHPEGSTEDRIFHELPDLIGANRVMFFNNSEVIRARIPLPGARSVKAGRQDKVFDGEIFFLEEVTLPLDKGLRDSGGVITKTPRSPTIHLNKGASSHTFKAMVYPGDHFPVGGTVYFQDIAFRVEETVYEGRILSIRENPPLLWRRGARGEAESQDCHVVPPRNDETLNIWSILDRYGQMPLPPYIKYDESKESQYQPIFAEKRGSLAAPTASLHFTDRILSGLADHGIRRETVTLHVGLGTFKNIYEPDIRDYEMHAERAEVPIGIFETITELKQSGQVVLAVGTTVTRTLESLPYLWTIVRDEIDTNDTTRAFWDSMALYEPKNALLSSVLIHREEGKIHFSSRIFIYADYPWHIVDEIITNFHLPSSTLFILVSSFLGLSEAKKLYEYAISKRYRFFSFGDGMYLKKRK